MTKVFLSYARVNAKSARQLFEVLRSTSGLEPWFDEESLPIGMKWRPAIRKAIREADYFLALLSTRSCQQRGVRHSELNQALEILAEWPPDHVYLIPARLDDCQMPRDELDEINRVDLFPDWNRGIERLCATLRPREAQIPPSTDDSRSAAGHFRYHYRVGLVDLDIGLTDLPRLVHELNAIQQFFHFTCPRLPSVNDAVTTIGGLKNLAVFQIPSEFFAEHKLLAVDLVACLTRYPLAFRENERILYNYFSGPSDPDERFMFISTDHLYDFVRQANCSFEQGIVYILVGQLVQYFMKIGYHKDTRGCVLDFCLIRADMVEGLRDRHFCPLCLSGLSPEPLKQALEALLSWNP